VCTLGTRVHSTTPPPAHVYEHTRALAGEITREGRDVITITLTNLKGGSSKSNSVFSLSSYYSRTGRVLVADCDAQGSLGSSYFNSTTVDSLPKRQTVATLFDADAPPAKVSEIIRPTGIPNIDILPANIALAEYNTNTPVDYSTTHLAQFLAESEVRSRYRVCIIDTPPSMQRCTISALVASDWALIPVQAELPAVLGISHVLKTLDAVKAVNKRLGLLGLFVTMYDARLSLHGVYERVLRERYGPLLFEQKVPLAGAFKEAIVRHTPVTIGAPRTAAAAAIRGLGAEIDSRIGLASRDGPQPVTEAPNTTSHDPVGDPAGQVDLRDAGVDGSTSNGEG
jgi:chromosome partitioning protein